MFYTSVFEGILLQVAIRMSHFGGLFTRRGLCYPDVTPTANCIQIQLYCAWLAALASVRKKVFCKVIRFGNCESTWIVNLKERERKGKQCDLIVCPWLKRTEKWVGLVEIELERTRNPVVVDTSLNRKKCAL